jgi:hypothetical protein
MKMYKNLVFIVRDNLLGSYYLEVGYNKVPAAAGMTFQTQDNFVSLRTFAKSKDMLEYLDQFKDEQFDLSMAIDPLVPDHIIEKYFEDQENGY